MNEVRILQQHHREILRRAAMGESISAIYKSLPGWTKKAVKDMVESEIGQREIERLNGLLETQDFNIREQVVSTAAYGAQVLDKVLRDKETPLGMQVKIADQALGRAGYGSQSGSGMSLHLHVTPDDIKRVKEKSMEIQQSE